MIFVWLCSWWKTSLWCFTSLKRKPSISQDKKKELFRQNRGLPSFFFFKKGSYILSVPYPSVPIKHLFLQSCLSLFGNPLCPFPMLLNLLAVGLRRQTRSSAAFQGSCTFLSITGEQENGDCICKGLKSPCKGKEVGVFDVPRPGPISWLTLIVIKKHMRVGVTVIVDNGYRVPQKLGNWFV